MANIKSAKKRIRVIDKKTARNKRTKAHIKSILKSFDAAIEDGDLDAAKQQLTLAEKKLMQSVGKGTMHKNAAARKVSRLTKRFNQASKA
ncbi:MAG: 30S ribosomal protein S20 [Eubacteriaceae bacterium]|nr:30S ribosomal protein S20 [Eubacteriaceae bacterium]